MQTNETKYVYSFSFWAGTPWVYPFLSRSWRVLALQCSFLLFWPFINGPLGVLIFWWGMAVLAVTIPYSMIKGREWSSKNRKWKSFNHYQAWQKNVEHGLAVLLIPTAILGGIMLAIIGTFFTLFPIS